MADTAKLKKKAADFEQRKQFDKALAVYGELLGPNARIDDLDIALFNRVGDLYQRQGQSAEALRSYERAADLYAERGFYTNAIAVCNRILRQTPSRAEIFLKLGSIKVATGLRSDAQQHLEEYIALMRGQSRLDYALNALRRFADENSDNEDAQLVVAEILGKNGRVHEAIIVLEAFRVRLQSLGHSAAARGVVERIRSLDPSYTPASGAPAVPGELLDENGLVIDDPGSPAQARGTSPWDMDGLVFFEPPDMGAGRASMGGRSARLTPLGSAPIVRPTPRVVPVTGQPQGIAAEVRGLVDMTDVLEVAPFLSESSPDAVPAENAFIDFNDTDGGEEGAPTALDADTAPVELASYDDLPIESEPIELASFATDLERAVSDQPSMPEIEIEIPEPVEELSASASGEGAELATVERPDDRSEEETESLVALAPNWIQPGSPDSIDSTIDLVSFDAAVAAAENGFGAPSFDDPNAERLSHDDLFEVYSPPAEAQREEPESVEPPTAPDVEVKVPVAETPATTTTNRPSRPFLRPVLTPRHPQTRIRPVHSGADRDARHDSSVEGARHLAESGDSEGAARMLRELLARHEENSRLTDVAIVLDELARVEPDSLGVHHKRVELACRLDDRSRLVTAYLGLAGALRRHGKDDRARAVFQRVLDLEPKRDDARVALEAEPLPASETVADVAPAKPASNGSGSNSFVDLGAMLRDEDEPRSTRMVTEELAPTGDEQADFADMLRKFTQGVSETLDADDHESHYDLGIAYREMGLLDEAIAAFQRALRGTDRRARSYEALGQCFLDKGQFTIANAVLRNALQEPGSDDQQLVGVLYLLGQAAEGGDNHGDAVAYYQRVLAVDVTFGNVTARLDALGQVAR